MAIYHLEAKVVSRGTGRSAVAASAYLSCTNILNDYDGVRHDYTRKKGLIWREVFLPEYAPPEWKDRGVLWNAVEENEKTKDSRLAREFVPALPVELTPTQWQELLSDFIKESFCCRRDVRRCSNSRPIPSRSQSPRPHSADGASAG